MERDDYHCVYCGIEACEIDHIVPWSFLHDDSLENLVASCWLCNSLASNNMFEDFKEKKEYILERVERFINKHTVSIWTDDEKEEIGPSMWKRISGNIILVKDESTKERARESIEQMGLKVITK